MTSRETQIQDDARTYDFSKLTALLNEMKCVICGRIGDPDDHGGNCAEKAQVLRDFEQERGE